MPPKKNDNYQNNPGGTPTKRPRKKNKPQKKKEECPSRIRKTDRVVLNSQARNIIEKVYAFMKKEALAQYAEKLTDARWRTATAVGVSQRTVTRILKEKSKKNCDAVGTVVGGKLALADNALKAVGKVAQGDVSGALDNVGKGVNAMVSADVSAVKQLVGATPVGDLASGVLDTAGSLTGGAGGQGLLGGVTGAVGTVVGGKLALVDNALNAVGKLAQGDVSGALDNVGDGVNAMVSADVSAVKQLVGATPLGDAASGVLDTAGSLAGGATGSLNAAGSLEGSVQKDVNVNASGATNTGRSLEVSAEKSLSGSTTSVRERSSTSSSTTLSNGVGA